MKLCSSDNQYTMAPNEELLVHCSTVDNDYQEYSRVLHTFIPNRLFRQ